MVFSSVSFLFYFLPAFLVAYFAFGFKNVTILLFSLVFYAWGEPRFLLVLILYIVVNYAVGYRIGQGPGNRKIWMTIGVAANLMLLVYFKYCNFLTTQLHLLTTHLGLPEFPVTHVALPLGISFIAFQGISYIVDVYRGVVPSQKSLLNFAMYKAMFPQLIAGPIVRYSDIVADIEHRPVRFDNLVAGTRQFIMGLGQKVLIANVVAVPADQIFAERGIGLSTAWFGLACYTLQIFFDFAGYSNMAIGLGRIMGFRYPINFDRPYASQSITEFWRRWHMTLSRWFRDYLYIPLGGNRGSRLRTYANLLIVFLLCGFWHGANWTFVIWGAYHGAFLVVERMGLDKGLQALWAPLRHLYTLLVVAGGWVFFRCDTLDGAEVFLRALAGRGDGAPLLQIGRYASVEAMLALGVGFALATAPWNMPQRYLFAPERGAPFHALALAAQHLALLAIFALCLFEISDGAYNPFIYYRF